MVAGYISMAMCQCKVIQDASVRRQMGTVYKIKKSKNSPRF